MSFILQLSYRSIGFGVLLILCVLWTGVARAQTYHAAPTARISQLVQENVLGAVRAPTGEVHIRGQHGELTYYIDGAPIPLGVFGGLNEVVDPKVIEQSTFLTGGFPAEYGGQ